MFQWLARLIYPSGQSDQPLINDGEFVYALPYEPGRRFRVTADYGSSYPHNGESHCAIDFAMPEHTAICAARGGVVYHVIDHFSEGSTDLSFRPKANAIYVLHTDDTIAAYVHLLCGGSVVRAGDPVAAGQVIGYSGNTGWSGSPHLHFHVADAFFHRRIPTKFHTVECGVTTLTAGRSYTRSTRPNRRLSSSAAHRDAGTPDPPDNDRNAFAFSAELVELAESLCSELASAGFERMEDYSSIGALHDVHGLEVCGIQSPQVALEITRLLLRQFPGWSAGWLHAPDRRSPDQWVASIRRDRDLTMEYWETD